MSAPFALEWLTRRPYCDLHPRFLRAVERFKEWPAPEHYGALAEQVPRAPGVRLPGFVTENREALRAQGGYEQHVARLDAVPTRSAHWHDFFNMAVWAHFPQLRRALNSLHVDPQAGPIDPRNGRAPAQNLAATFDESGLLVLSTSHAVLEELRGLRFKRAFWELRAEVLATTRFWAVGHGMLEALLSPRPGLVARGLLLHVPSLPPSHESDALRFEIDARVSAGIHGWRSARPVLDPLPVLAIPGFSDNDAADFYEDARNIRFVPVSRRPSAGG
jgi:hypothetical protein